VIDHMAPLALGGADMPWQKHLRLWEERGPRGPLEGALKWRAQTLLSQVEVTLKTADALLIQEAGRKIKDAGPLTLENGGGIC
jgi:hypothetical protein